MAILHCPAGQHICSTAVRRGRAIALLHCQLYVKHCNHAHAHTENQGTLSIYGTQGNILKALNL